MATLEELQEKLSRVAYDTKELAELEKEIEAERESNVSGCFSV